jgi:tRNA 2-thiouridine synthesizing protein A
MTKEIDARGLSCPIPVVKTKKAMEEYPNEVLEIFVETETSKENVIRLAKSNNYNISVDSLKDDIYRLILSPKKDTTAGI